MDFLSGYDIADWIALALSVIGVFSVIATMTPNETDNKIVDGAYKIVNFLAANFGKAKNDPNA